MHYVVGAGAIGHLVSCLLTRGTISVTLVTRSNPTNANHKVVQFHHADQIYPLTLSMVSLERIHNPHYLWIAVKSYQLQEALESVSAFCQQNTRIVLLQNGMGNLERATSLLSAYIPADQILPAVVTHGAYIDSPQSPTEVFHTGIGEIILGENYLVDSPSSSAEWIAQLPPSLHARWSESIEDELWLKLGINAVVNPVTAYYQCRNGDLLAITSLREEVEILIEELIEFYISMNRHYLAESFRARCYQVIEKTADNYSSMMRDVKHGRKTEIEAITGYLLNTANRFRLVMSGHQMQYQRLCNS